LGTCVIFAIPGSWIPPGIGGIQEPGMVENYPRIPAKPQSLQNLSTMAKHSRVQVN